MTKKRRRGNHSLWGLNLPAVQHALQVLEKEIKYYTAMLPAKRVLLKEAQKNLNGFMRKIQHSQVAHLAKNLASHKGSEMLSFLNFPTKRDVAQLSARLSRLEKRMKGLSHGRRARA